MYLPTIKKELLSNILSLRYALIFFLFLALTLAATVARTEMHKRMTRDYDTVTSLRNAAIGDTTVDFWNIDNHGIFAKKRPNPLSIFAGGLETEMTRTFQLSSQMPTHLSPRDINIPAYRTGLQLDMITIVSIVCSLLALLLMFDSVCGEREAGTLKMMLSGPMPRDVIIVSKIIAGMVTLITPLLLTWLLNILYVTAIAHVALNIQEGYRLCWLIVLSCLYVGFFSALGIAVSCWVQRSATALITCLFFWTLAVLALPNLIPMIVNRVSPIPAESKIIQEKNAIHGDLNNERQKWREEAGATGQYETLERIDSVVNAKYWDEFRKREAQVDRFYQECVNRQIVLNQQVARISPAASFVYAATHLTGAGMRDCLKLLSTVNDYSQSVNAYLQDGRDRTQKLFNEYQEKANSGQQNLEVPRPIKLDAGTFPKFSYALMPLSTTLNNCWIDMAILLCGCVLLFMLGFIGFIRYDVR